ncbi:MAG: hypothetical protein O3A51_14295 [Verrucomicrobia bacterium]|nr:hypothetical protein [Verrucomicrobiota bacterium]
MPPRLYTKLQPYRGGATTFSSFSDGITIQGSNVAFSARLSNGEAGVYWSQGFSGPIQTIADWNTLVPGTADTFSERFYYLSAVGDALYFTGASDSTVGLYVYRQGALERVADTQTAVPEQAGTFFTGYKHIMATDDTVSFAGEYDGGQGLYRIVGNGPIRRVLDHTTTLPVEPSHLTAYSAGGVDNRQVAFLGSAGYRQGGIYSDVGGEIHQVITYTNRIMDGREATSFLMRPGEAFNANRLVYHSAYTYQEGLPSNSAIWLATVTAIKLNGFLLLVR